MMLGLHLTIACVFIAVPALAGTYWVSPTGAATWAACASDTPLSGAAACPRSEIRANAVAGDVVYFRGGTYTISGAGQDSSGVRLNNSGSDAAHRITLSRHGAEVPVITGPAGTYGIYFSGTSYIKVDGLTFQDVPTWAYVVDASHYNEITNCVFTATPGNEAGVGFMINGTSCETHDCWNTHNWIHGNTFSKRISPSGVCNEGVDLIRIGSAYGDGNTVENDNYNTIENNRLAYTGHTILANFGMYNVIRDNISHNEPWYSGCTNYEKGTSDTSLSVGTGSKTLTTQIGLSLSGTIGLIDAVDGANAMRGSVTSYNAGNGDLVVSVTYATGSGTHSSWILSQGNYPFYVDASYNGLYGHRNFQMSDDYGRSGTYDLVEGNRLGHAGMNPNNDGSENLTMAAPRNIVRHNLLFNSMASGIFFKYADSEVCTSRDGNGRCGAINNRIYNNTLYHNGYGVNWRAYGDMNQSYTILGVFQYNASGTGSTGNVIKNNIIYDSAEGAVCAGGLKSGPCTAETWDTVENNLTTNPTFANPDLTDPTSATLPNLALQAGSSAIDGGNYLTVANGGGTNSMALVVDDALYFQDGSWGSDLARGVTFFPDWIAIGTVDNVVQISSINYATSTIALASAATWSDNAPIWLYKKSDGAVVLSGAAPDYGASEYIAPTSRHVGKVTGNARLQ